jgi:hypothetical protein
LRASLLIAVLLASAPPAKGPRPPAAAPAVKSRPPPTREIKDAGADAPVTTAVELKPARMGHAAPGDTPCSACHATSSWSDVRFNHDRTGFPLTGGHGTTSCKGCHAEDFKRPVPTTCGGCHRDVHAGDLGARCEGCHDTASWASRFDADAHRRTAFPLVGAHAAIPCLECHAESSGRRFARPAVECTTCHLADLNRTRGTALDHVGLNFTASCRSCHNAFRFKPALFPNHDVCYLISSGPHSLTPCLGCHTTLSGISTTPGTCSTRTAACTQCHEHLCAGPTGTMPTDLLHQQPKVAMPVPGYQCADRKCYQCHKEVGAAR